jgi:cytochrome c-type biogenesis protein CcmH/NrfF
MRRAVAAAFALIALAATPALAVAPKTTLHAIEQQVMCVTCNIPLEVAESPAADDERAYIRTLIAQGLTVSQIKNKLVLDYGDSVLDLPPNHGFNTIFYVLPIVGGLAAIALVAFLLPRWRRRNPPSDPQGGGPALSAADTARLDADMAGFDG